MPRLRIWVFVGAALALLLTACGDDDGSSSDGGASADNGGTDSSADASSGDDDSAAGEDASSGDDDSAAGEDASGGGGGAGTLVLGDETIAFDSARCFLEEQDAAGGGGKILFVAQAFGTNAAGDQIAIDVSRYDEDSQFTGDVIIVDIGDPSSDAAVSLSANADLGTVAIDGSTLSAANLTFVNSDDLSEQPGSFEINC